MANKDNPAIGARFEISIQNYLRADGLSLERPFILEIGAFREKRPHKFDMGSRENKIVIECKSHGWTKGENAPSAKMSVWNEAMYYFYLTPRSFRKMFFIKKSMRNGKSLGKYYMERYLHLIPKDVELWEYCIDTNKAWCLYKQQVIY